MNLHLFLAGVYTLLVFLLGFGLAAIYAIYFRKDRLDVVSSYLKDYDFELVFKNKDQYVLTFVDNLGEKCYVGYADNFPSANLPGFSNNESALSSRVLSNQVLERYITYIVKEGRVRRRNKVYYAR